MLMKLVTNITIPAMLYFLLFLSLAIPKKHNPLLAKVKAVNKSMKFPKAYILQNDNFETHRNV